jgi:hypothetical protein
VGWEIASPPKSRRYVRVLTLKTKNLLAQLEESRYKADMNVL